MEQQATLLGVLQDEISKCAADIKANAYHPTTLSKKIVHLALDAVAVFAMAFVADQLYQA
jgi:hypothetical protein